LKRIPRWALKNLPSRLLEILFDNMVLGDGTIRQTSKKSIIYYTVLPNLANDVNELAILCGWESSLWGPYKQKTAIGECLMYQVHVNKNVEQYRALQTSNIKKIHVKDHRIVCFTVPNMTLITRRNGRVGFHGNSKHASQLIRILRTGVDILEAGKLNVRRPDAEYLLAIKNGLKSYDEVVEESQKLSAKMDELYKSNPAKLPKTVDVKYIDKLFYSLIMERHGK